MTTVEQRVQLIFSIRQAGVTDKNVLSAMEAIDRSVFMDGIFKARAFEDVPLPIAAGQTISAPSVVAKMTQALEVTKKHKVLEIGTGSGYQAAVLSKLARRVYTVERIRSLAILAKERIESQGITNVWVEPADGSFGMERQAPFDRILVTAAAEDPPSTLLAQLAIDGIMVIPVGQSDAVQTLIRIKKTATGLEYEDLGEVRFVPLLPGKEM